MPAMKKSDLKYDDYSWTAVPGDNPRRYTQVRTVEHLSEKVEYIQ